jgi:biopolymer transport protein ExbB
MRHQGNKMKKSVLIRIVICIVAAAVIGYVILRAMQTQSGENTSASTFFGQFVVAGGFVVWFIQIPLSIITVYLIIENVVTIRRKTLVPAGISREIITTIRQFGYKQLPARIPRKSDLISTAIKKAIMHNPADTAQLEQMTAESLQHQTAALLRKVEWHNIIGNISPMIGLFGTVLGMIEIFNKMGLANGQANHGQLAHGISVAWVTTLWGLVTAIPALTVHGIFRNRIETLAGEAVTEAEMVLLEFKRTAAIKNRGDIDKVPIDILPEENRRQYEAKD